MVIFFIKDVIRVMVKSDLYNTFNKLSPKNFNGFNYFVTNPNDTSSYVTIVQSPFYKEKEELIIPSHIEGFPVQTIGYNAFEGSEIKRLIIPNTVFAINDYAFNNCQFLTDVVFGNNLKCFLCNGISSFLCLW